MQSNIWEYIDRYINIFSKESHEKVKFIVLSQIICMDVSHTRSMFYVFVKIITTARVAKPN